MKQTLPPTPEQNQARIMLLDLHDQVVSLRYAFSKVGKTRPDPDKELSAPFNKNSADESQRIYHLPIEISGILHGNGHHLGLKFFIRPDSDFYLPARINARDVSKLVDDLRAQPRTPIIEWNLAQMNAAEKFISLLPVSEHQSISEWLVDAFQQTNRREFESALERNFPVFTWRPERGYEPEAI
ncbi:MAG: hypothetical protein J0L77_06505 [Alphaproteobacteria bacterium]|nr:hypothetical protein [Alphaproteobacteria bacterium]